MTGRDAMTIVLASASRARRALLEAGRGSTSCVDPAAIDEAAIKESLARRRRGAGGDAPRRWPS